jgi:hypothetical protein
MQNQCQFVAADVTLHRTARKSSTALVLSQFMFMVFLAWALLGLGKVSRLLFVAGFQLY